jgi:hypothetical protein
MILHVYSSQNLLKIYNQCNFSTTFVECSSSIGFHDNMISKKAKYKMSSEIIDEPKEGGKQKNVENH